MPACFRGIFLAAVGKTDLYAVNAFADEIGKSRRLSRRRTPKKNIKALSRQTAVERPSKDTDSARVYTSTTVSSKYASCRSNI